MRNDDTFSWFAVAMTTSVLMLVLMAAYGMGKAQSIGDVVVDCTHLGKFRSHGKTFECKEIHR